MSASRVNNDWRWHVAEAERLLDQANNDANRWRGEGIELAYRAQVHLQLVDTIRRYGVYPRS